MKPTRLYIEPEADAELEEAADRYESSVAGLGLDFLAEMRKRTRDVFEHPDGFPHFGEIEGVHCAHAVGRFPHLVVYMTAKGREPPEAKAGAGPGEKAAACPNRRLNAHGR